MASPTTISPRYVSVYNGRIKRTLFVLGGRPAPGGGVRRAGARAGDRGRARAGRGGLARQHRVPRRLPRRAPRHRVVLAGHRQVTTLPDNWLEEIALNDKTA